MVMTDEVLNWGLVWVGVQRLALRNGKKNVMANTQRSAGADSAKSISSSNLRCRIFAINQLQLEQDNQTGDSGKHRKQ